MQSEQRQRRALVFCLSGLGDAILFTPALALFGPTDWRRLHLWSGHHVVVRNELLCMPCFYCSSPPLRCVANVNYACLREI
ncbi:MAG: hypothetical protein ABSG14_11905 [Verrucomicrobiia bacterium]|jgi:hypothetical protein